MATLEDLRVEQVRELMAPNDFLSALKLIESVQGMTRSDQTLSAEVWDGLVCRVVFGASAEGYLACCTCPRGDSVCCPHVGAVMFKSSGRLKPLRQ